MKNKKTILAIVALILVVGIMLGVYLATRPQTSEGSKTFTVTVVHGDKTSKEFTYKTDEAFLGPVLVAEGLIVMDDEQTSMFNTVDGETAIYETDKAYWALYVGDDYAMTGINDTPVEDGSVFRLEYTVG